MTRCRMPLDAYDIISEGHRVYLMNYGKHFNRKMYEFAVSHMRNRSGEKMKPIDIDALQKMLSSNGIKIDNDVMYDGCYVYSMAMSDFMGSSIEDEKHLLLYVKDLIDDSDQRDGFIFYRFYSDCVNSGIPMDWSEML